MMANLIDKQTGMPGKRLVTCCSSFRDKLLCFLSVSCQGQGETGNGYKNRNCWVHLLAGLLILAFFLTLVLSRNAASSFFYPLVLLCFWAVARTGARPRLERWEVAGLMIVAAWFGLAVLSHVYNDFPGNGLMMIGERYSKLIYAIPVFLYFRQFPLNIRFLWLVAVLLSVETGIISLLERWNDEIFLYPGRASGNVHPITFALIAACGACMAITLADYRNIRHRVLTTIALLLALLAIILSGSRGIWVALPVLGYVILWLRYRKAAIKPLLYFTLAILVAGAVSYQNPYVKMRVDSALSNVESYLASTDVSDSVRYSSMGGRLEMWRAAVAMISSHPWLGVGPDGFREQSRQLVDSGEWSGKLLEHMFPHNIYLTAWTTTGFLGLMAMLAFFSGCLIVYGNAIRQIPGQGSQIASAGLLITILYMIGGLSDDNMAQKLALTVFVLMQSLLLGHLSYFRRCERENR